MNINKIVLAVLLAFLLTGYHIKAIGPPGFYIGLSGGYTNISGKLNYDFSRKDVDPKAKLMNSDMGTYSPTFGFFLGHDWKPFDPDIYLGYEFFLQHEKIRAQSENIQAILSKSEISKSKIKFKENDTFGATTKIGYLYKDSLFFLKSGIVFMIGHINKNSIPYEPGFIIGIGMDYALNHNWSIGGEFICETYGSIKLFHQSYSIISYKPKKFTSNIRLKYNF